MTPKLPNHIAIIMDGNRRWARRNTFKILRGHEAGADSVRNITTECAKIGIKELTLYAFSTENRDRDNEEIGGLWRLLDRFCHKERPTVMDNNIRLRAIGRIVDIPEPAHASLLDLIGDSSSNTGMIMRLALNYGGHAEILDAINALLEKRRKEGRPLDGPVSHTELHSAIYDPEMTEVDLLIRPGAERRVSNFLLWHISYAEFYFSDVLWPDFSIGHLHEAIAEYQRRDRRKGK
ncbi:MAG: polyprenyl diphosphate synthase [Planctomycetota bacterium]